MSRFGMLLEDVAVAAGMGRSAAGVLRRDAEQLARDIDDLEAAAKQTNTDQFDASFIRASDGYFSSLPHEGASVARDSGLSIDSSTWTLITWEDEADLAADYQLWTYNKGMRVESDEVRTEHATPVGSAFIVFGGIHFAANAVGSRELRVYTTDGGWTASAAIPTITTGGSTNVHFAQTIQTTSANPGIRLFGYQNSGGALNVQAATMGVVRIK